MLKNHRVLIIAAFALISCTMFSQVMKVHNGASMTIYGDANNTPGVIDANAKANAVHVFGGLNIAGNISSATSGSELRLDGDLKREQTGTVRFKQNSDVVMYNLSAHQSILGAFTGNNNFYNLISNKNSGYRVDIDSSVEVANVFLFNKSGYFRTDRASYTLGSSYKSKLILSSTNPSSFKNYTTVIGDKNNIVEGQLERNTISSNEYVFPVSVDLSDAVGGAQVAVLNVTNGSGKVVGSFSRDSGLIKLNYKDPNNSLYEATSVLEHGFWNLDNINKDVKEFNLEVKAHNVLDNYGVNKGFTIVKKQHGAPRTSYYLEGVDPYGYGAASTSSVVRQKFTSFSDFAIAIVKDTTGNNGGGGVKDSMFNKIPNYFSPNGDGINDKFDLTWLRKYYPNLKLTIFNRWGNIVYRSIGPYNNDWGGEHQLNDSPVPDGVYYYIIELDSEFNKTRTGFVEIMRN